MLVVQPASACSPPALTSFPSASSAHLQCRPCLLSGAAAKLGSAGHAGSADSGADHACLVPDLRDRVAVLHPRGGVVVRLVEHGVPHDTEVELKTLPPNERARSVEQVLNRVGPLRRVDT